MRFRLRPVWRFRVSKLGKADIDASLSVSAGLVHKQTGLRTKNPMSMSVRGALRFRAAPVQQDTVIVTGHPDDAETVVKIRETRFRQLRELDRVVIVWNEDTPTGYQTLDE